MSDNTLPITRRSALRAAGMGAVASTGLIAFTGSAAAHCPCDTCVKVGKVDSEDINDLEVGDTFTFWYEGDDIVIEITDISRKGDGEVECIDIQARPDLQETNVGHALCRVDVKGGRDTVTYACNNGDGDHFDYATDGSCVSTATDLCPPEHHSPHVDYYGLSHFTVWVCDFNGSDQGLGGSCTV